MGLASSFAHGCFGIGLDYFLLTAMYKLWWPNLLEDMFAGQLIRLGT